MYTWYGSSAVLSSGSQTTRLVCLPSRLASTPSSESTERCCATTIGWRTSSCNPSRSRLTASRPPHDVPITMTSYISTRARLPVHPLGGVDLLVLLRVRGERERLLVTEREDPERREAVVEEA